MSKSKSKGTAKARAKQEAATQAAQTLAERDAKQYGEVLFSVTYDIEEDVADKASYLYGSKRSSDLAILMVVVGLIGMIATFVLHFGNAVVAIFSFVIAMTGSVATGNWHSIQCWALMGSNMGESKDDIRRHNVVTPTEIVVEGPGTQVNHYPLSQLKRVRHNENGCLASFGKGRVAFFPAAKMSRARQRELQEFLGSKQD